METISYTHPEQPLETQYEILSSEFMRSIRNSHRDAALFKKDYAFYKYDTPPLAAASDSSIGIEEYIARQMIMHEDPTADWERSYYFSVEDQESTMHMEITHYEGYEGDVDSGLSTTLPKNRVDIELSLTRSALSEIEFKILLDGGLGSIINDVVSFQLDADGTLILPNQATYLISSGVFKDEVDFLDFYTSIVGAAQSDQPFAAYELLLQRSQLGTEDQSPGEIREITSDLTFEEDLAYYINRKQTIAEIADFIIDATINPSSKFFGKQRDMFNSTPVKYIDATVFGHDPENITLRRIAASVSDIEYLIDQTESNVRVYGAILDATETDGAFNELYDRFMNNPNFNLPALARDQRHFDTFGFRLELVEDDDEIAWVLQSMYDALPKSRRV